MVILALVALVVILVVSGIRIVPQSQRVIIERLGKFHKILEPGINVIFPILDREKSIVWIVAGKGTRPTSKLDMREQVYDFPRQNVISRDNVFMEINALLYFQINNPFKAVYEIANLPLALEKLTQTSLRSVMGEMDLDEILSKRAEINERLRVTLDEATDAWGVKVTRVEIQDVNPPESVQTAMQKQMESERSRRARVTEAEGQKRAQILEAEGGQQAQINRAEGEKEALILNAEARAQARVRQATAEAEAIASIAEAVKAAGGDPTQYLIALKYMETLHEMVSGRDNKVVYLPYEATALLGSLGGLKEIFTGKPEKA
ncbi:SPFH/Band 7/PHB domain protein [Aminithiophilus ramosus]|uniref:SPFH/Band 7/PHB domain protein n=2 Tax=Synergistales TaxID=649776 RepID=A0A9Q7AMT7_9BACT|nr:SPFH domain-containing protein [Aminithiophilus ramosus]QTX31787.1 SPFH/Band 7/PHB domain protein [Aminithiophilus ramosus]QVL35609.1 SPFH/Band 7/PHB domain protein [Synergistota bacterium]